MCYSFTENCQRQQVPLGIRLKRLPRSEEFLKE